MTYLSKGRQFILVPVGGKEHPAELVALAEISGWRVDEKEAWLADRQSLPVLSEEARRFLRDADIIIYGPGTQHSSLLHLLACTLERLRGRPNQYHRQWQFRKNRSLSCHSKTGVKRRPTLILLTGSRTRF